MKLALPVLQDALAHNLLHLILMPTEACNFRCTYCYEDFAVGRMAPGVVSGVKALLSERAPELDRLSIWWFGGEPLLARDVVEDVMEHVGALRREHPHIALEGQMTTNAWSLTPPVFERLVALGVVGYQITLDGLEQRHDNKRVLAGGGGTFDRIWSNLLALRSVDARFQVTVRLHLDRENRAELVPFLDRFREAFGVDERFSVFARPLSRFGGANDAQLGVLDADELDETLETARDWARSTGEGVLREEHSSSASPPICYAARANSLLVRADGRVGKCTLALEHERNTVGRIDESGRLALDDGRMLEWMRGLDTGDAEELRCPMIGYADTQVTSA